MCPVVSVGMNPSQEDKNKQICDDLVTGRPYLMVSELLRVYSTDGTITEKLANELMSVVSNYFSGSVHPFFGPLTYVLQSINCSYTGNKPNLAVHLDVFPWATTVRWGEIPPHIQQSFLQYSWTLADEIKRLRPHVVIFGLKDFIASLIFPNVHWELFCLYKTEKEYEVVVNKAWLMWEFEKKQHKVLFIQSKPCRFPFAFLSKEQKLDLGTKIQKELIENSVIY